MTRGHRWTIVVPAVLLAVLAPTASATESRAGNGERKYPSSFAVSPDFPGST